MLIDNLFKFKRSLICLRPSQLSVRWPLLSVKCDHGGSLTVTISVHLTLPTENLPPLLPTKSPTPRVTVN